jgi:hypothetical protein
MKVCFLWDRASVLMFQRLKRRPVRLQPNHLREIAMRMGTVLNRG